MIIKRLNGLHQAKDATGLVVVIDVLRAASVEAYLLDQGVEYIFPVDSPEKGLLLKNEFKNSILVGEKDGKILPGYDINNSPSDILSANITQKIAIHSSTFGTKGLESLINADEIIFGSLVISNSILRYIKLKNPKILSILALGEDDDYVAEYFEKKIKNVPCNESEIIDKIKSLPFLSGYFDSKMTQFPVKDLDLCLAFNKFNFICSVNKVNDQLRTTKKLI